MQKLQINLLVFHRGVFPGGGPHMDFLATIAAGIPAVVTDVEDQGAW